MRITSCFRGAWLGVGVRLPVADQLVEHLCSTWWYVNMSGMAGILSRLQQCQNHLIDEGISWSLADLDWQSSDGCPGKAHMVGSEGADCWWGD